MKVSSRKISSMELVDSSMPTRASTMDSGRKAKSKEKVCTYTPIRMFSLVTGLMEKNTAKEPMFLTQQG
jgi:hypothetical protein